MNHLSLPTIFIAVVDNKIIINCCLVAICAVDDMVDTAGTLCKAAEILKENGARRVFAFATHGVLSGPAPQRIANSVLTELVVLDTVPLSEASLVRILRNQYVCNVMLKS